MCPGATSTWAAATSVEIGKSRVSAMRTLPPSDVVGAWSIILKTMLWETWPCGSATASCCKAGGGSALKNEQLFLRNVVEGLHIN
jgi:hypothetical protein